MMTIDLRGGKKKIETVLEEQSVQFSLEIINSICDAIDCGVSRITCLVVITDSDEFSFTASRYYYEQALRANMENLIRAELYESCARALKYIGKLNTRLIEDKKYLDN
jgi:hypothetical protein